jgi:hypothetical protein
MPTLRRKKRTGQRPDSCQPCVGGNGQAKGLDHTSPGQRPGFIATEFILQAEGLLHIVSLQVLSIIGMPQSLSQVIIHIVFRGL